MGEVRSEQLTIQDTAGNQPLTLRPQKRELCDCHNGSSFRSGKLLPLQDEHIIQIERRFLMIPSIWQSALFVPPKPMLVPKAICTV